MRAFCYIICLLIGFCGSGVAQPADSIPKANAPRAFSLFPIPVVYYTPETRFAYGIALSATFRFRRDYRLVKDDTARAVNNSTSQPRPSNIQLIGAYTQNKQLLLFVPFQVFYDRNQYYFYGEAGYYKYSYNFFGAGEREVPAENYSVNFPRIRLNAFRRVRPNVYAGLRYEYEKYDVTKVDPDGLLTTDVVPGGLGSLISGAGVGLLYDTRDNVFYPSKGVFADFSYLGHGSGTGSAFSYNRYVADVSSYHSLNKRVVLAVNYVVSLTGGTAPFNAMSALGSGKKLRGYYEARFRDENAALLQTELRVNVWKRLSAVVFGGIGVLGNSQQLLRFDAPKAAGGAGLRVRINDDRLNIRADYGIGNGSTGLYLTIGEAF